MDRGRFTYKGQVMLKVMHGFNEIFRIQDWSKVAPHEMEEVSEMYDEDHYFVKNLVEGCHFEFWYVVGAGGGHILIVQDFSVDLMSVEGIL